MVLPKNDMGFLKNWNYVYLIVIGFLILTISFLFFMTNYFE